MKHEKWKPTILEERIWNGFSDLHIAVDGIDLDYNCFRFGISVTSIGRKSTELKIKHVFYRLNGSDRLIFVTSLHHWMQLSSALRSSNCLHFFFPISHFIFFFQFFHCHSFCVSLYFLVPFPFSLPIFLNSFFYYPKNHFWPFSIVWQTQKNELKIKIEIFYHPLFEMEFMLCGQTCVRVCLVCILSCVI